jgi:hypothetical protein
MDVTTCHNYDINYKYRWQCQVCQMEYGRHSKSIDVDKSRCGKCHGRYPPTQHPHIPQHSVPLASSLCCCPPPSLTHPAASVLPFSHSLPLYAHRLAPVTRLLADGTPSKRQQGPGIYAQFVKSNFKSIKADNPDLTPAQVCFILTTHAYLVCVSQASCAMCV